MPISVVILSIAVACVWAGMQSKFSFLFLFLFMLVSDYCYWIQLKLFSQWVGLDIFSSHILFNPISPFWWQASLFSPKNLFAFQLLLQDEFLAHFFLKQILLEKILTFQWEIQWIDLLGSFQNILRSIRFEYSLCVLFQTINGQSSNE